jgi:hypothetical protein
LVHVELSKIVRINVTAEENAALQKSAGAGKDC